MTDVAVTTSTDSFPRWADLLTAAGLQPVSLPCIEIVPASDDELDLARRTAADADALLLTSPRTVGLLWPEAGMPAVPVAAVGSATAAAVREAGGVIEVVGDAGGDDLVAEWQNLDGRRIVFPHARGSDLGRLDTLKSRGAHVERFPVYESRPKAPGPDPVDAAVFASPSSVEGWLISRSLNELRVVGVIGATTAQAISGAGGGVDATTDVPSAESLVEALLVALERKP